MSATETVQERTSSWRLYVAGAVWAVIAIAVFSLYLLVTKVFALSLGVALHGTVTAAEQVPVFWGFVAVAIGMSIVVVAAIVARRWVALVFAILLVGVSGFFAVGLWSNVRAEIAPVEHVDPGPVPCQCMSGGDCDCPGG